MIKIYRIDCPSILDSNNRTLVKNDYNHGQVIDALSKMQYFKCCYCEKDLRLLGKSERWVEHFVAQSDESFKDISGNIDWNKANAWENLLYACGTCNRSKGTTEPFDPGGKRKVIDPSYRAIDPEKHVGFLIKDVLILYKERTNLGKDTIEILKLAERIDVYKFLRNAQRDINACFGEFVSALIDGDAITADSKLADLTRMSSAHLPHASFRRKYISQKVDRFNNNELQRINQHYGTQIQPITVDVANGYQVKS